VPPHYRHKFLHREIINGLEVYRSYVLPASNAQPKRRMLGFLTFLTSSVINSFRLKGKFDLIIASSPPVASSLSGYIISRLRRAKLVLEIRDLQPESGEQFGNLEKSIFTEIIRKVMRYLYKKADHVVCVTEGIAAWMKEHGVQESRLSTIKSGVGHDFLNSHSNGIRKKYGWEDKFLIVFSGTLGWVRPLESIVESARLLADNHKYHFVFIGDGQKRKSLEALAKQYNLNNISFVGLQPLEEIPYYLKASDVLVECLKEVPVARVALPTKIFEYMAAGKPIVFGSPDGEASHLLNQAGGALVYSPGNPTQLAELVKRIYQGQIDGTMLGQKYREFVNQNHTREQWASKYLDLLNKVGNS